MSVDVLEVQVAREGRLNITLDVVRDARITVAQEVQRHDLSSRQAGTKEKKETGEVLCDATYFLFFGVRGLLS